MEKKGINIVVFIISLIVVFILGWFGNQYFTKYFNSSDTNSNSSVKEESTTVMSEKEALKLGKEKYEYMVDLDLCSSIFELDGKVYSIDKDTLTVQENVQGAYGKITNIEDIKSNLTNNAFAQLIEHNHILHIDGSYYTVNSCGKSDPTHASDKYNLTVNEITNDMIVYDATEYDYATDENGVIEDLSKATKYVNKFILVKENDKWLIEDYASYYNSVGYEN